MNEECRQRTPLLATRMKRLVLASLLVAAPLLAQKSPVVASINGETITAEQLEQMYNRLPSEMREQYDRTGGKGALLENYIRKRLVLQEAKKIGFDQRPSVKADIEAAKESALFDRYVRDIVAGTIVNNTAMKGYYDANPQKFTEPEMIKVRHIVIGVNNTGPKAHTESQAMQLAQKAVTDVLTLIPRTDDPVTTAKQHAETFAKLARAYSEDAAGPSGGDLGWVTRGQLDPDFEKAAWGIRVGVPSGIVKTRYGYHIIFVEAKRAAGTMSFDEAKPRIRELLLQEHAQDIVDAVNKLTTELGDRGKIEVHPENIK
jgi:peptidyl-prolyl cis-trans isomerase C